MVEEMIVKMEDMPPIERVSLGLECVEKIHDGLLKMGLSETDISVTMMGFIRLFVSADKRCSKDEYCHIKSIYSLPITYEEFRDMAFGELNEEYVALSDEFIDSLSPELKETVCLFGLCILQSDENISDAEKELFDRILA